eukprot:Plantae.Rhodophyta-Hildenbrandia_rubra.ctg308.p3 GENE.Plantae.Rhodophyta-Hildenbrandia_rubra.ctg308~~Plantae.Rhodophyta-Hildenbrandia_rubra.ctg308.p3  ORF type:complete len:121 (-),score=20.16 Plantae.Rhodophyta-Hildenbrandia_rubra.ctg308:380-742(-)
MKADIPSFLLPKGEFGELPDTGERFGLASLKEVSEKVRKGIGSAVAKHLDPQAPRASDPLDISDPRLMNAVSTEGLSISSDAAAEESGKAAKESGCMQSAQQDMGQVTAGAPKEPVAGKS